MRRIRSKQQRFAYYLALNSAFLKLRLHNIYTKTYGQLMRDTAEVVIAGFALAAEELLDSLMRFISQPGAINDANIEPRLLGHSCSAAVLLGLSIEIGLKKILWESSRKKCLSHDHVKIFKKLPLKVKERLICNFDKGLLIYNQKNANNIDTNLEETLKISKNLFEGWRYIYEEKKDAPNFNAAASKIVVGCIVETLEDLSKKLYLHSELSVRGSALEDLG